MYRLFPSILDAITVVKPETVIRWHRRGFRAYWRWKSRRRRGRPRIDREIRDLIDAGQREPRNENHLPRRSNRIVAASTPVFGVLGGRCGGER